MGEWRETREAIRIFGLPKVLYWRFIYRHHMRFIHRRGGHQFTHLRPIDGAEQDWCQWCGHRIVYPALPPSTGKEKAE